MKKKDNKPMIETLINSAALILTPAGTLMVVNEQYLGLILIAAGIGLEYFKYFGRQQGLW